MTAQGPQVSPEPSTDLRSAPLPQLSTVSSLTSDFTLPSRVRFLLGGRHGEFKFLPPPGYAPCHEAVLPRERLHLEPIKEYRREGPRGPHLVGPSRCLSHTDFVPCPVDTVQVLPILQDSLRRQGGGELSWKSGPLFNRQGN